MTEEPQHHDYEVRDRRPMPPREWAVMRWFTDLAIRLRFSANDISVLSVVFAGLSAAALFLTSEAVGLTHRGLWLMGAVGVELRAFCNLLDGMVAVKSETASPVGELYNEVPDRISDILMLVGLGYAAGESLVFGRTVATAELGWIAATVAVLVAYVRAQAAVSGAGQDFAGLMSKPIRMQIVAAACVYMACAPSVLSMAFWGPKVSVGDKMMVPTWGVPQAMLILIIVGGLATAAGRLLRASRRLREGAA
ncbi:MAG: CDP-alcohol phosphatidyltransferase family protein [Planctomycetota bacterium]